MRDREKEKLEDFCPPIGCILIVVPGVLCALAWIFSIFVGWERYHWLKYLCLVPLVIILVVLLPTIVKKIRKLTEWRE